MSNFNWNKPNLVQPLSIAALLDESDYLAAKSSVNELQQITGDNTDTQGFNTQQLLDLQTMLEKLI